LRALPVLRHAFTHFRLLIRPWFATLDRQVLLAAEPKLTSTSKAATANLRWLPLTDVADAALPRPVKRLLLELPS
jgi:A/G-specific adenine glycosylase